MKRKSTVIAWTAIAAAALAAPAAAKTKIVVAESWGQGPWAGMFDEWTKVFEAEHPDIEIEFISLTGSQTDIRAKLETMIAAGTAPDINLWVWPQISRFYLDLQPFFDKDKSLKLNDFFPSSIQASTTVEDGRPKVYSMPGNPDAQMLWLNLDALSEAGLSYDPAQPWTWAQFQDTLGKLEKVDASNKVTRYGISLPFGWPWAVGPYIWTNGGTFVEQNPDTGFFDRSEMQNPKTIEALSWLRGLYARNLVGGNMHNGSAAMSQGWSSTASWKVPFKYDVLPIPVPQAGMPSITLANGSTMGGISVTSKHPQEAWEVLSFLGGDEGDGIRIKYMPHPPALRTSRHVEDWIRLSNNFHGDVFIQAMASGHLGPNAKLLGRDSDVTDFAAAQLKKVFDGSLDPKSAAAMIDEQLNGIFASLK